MRRSCLLLAGLVTPALFVPGTAAAQAPPMRDGLWAISIQMEMPNMPVAMPAMTTQQCITPEMLEDPESVMPQAPMGGPGGADAPDNDCHLEDYNLDGQTATWRMECTQPQAMVGEAEMTFSDDHYTGVMRMTMNGQQMTMNYEANRVGACEQ